MTISASLDDPDGDNAPRVFIAGDYVQPEPARGTPVVADSLAERIRAASLSLVNLEAPVDPPSLPAEKSGPAKRSAIDAPAALREAGFDAVTLANNHIMDYGEPGLKTTQSECDREGLASCGAGRNLDAAMEPLRTTVDGTSLSVFSFCEEEFGIATEDEPGVAPISHPEARNRVAAEAETADVVIVIAHGGVEFVPFSPPHRQSQLRGFVEAGADLVVGHHPHVPQGWEIHKGTPIFYSLGNFRFEMPNRPKTRWGLGLEVAIDGDGTASVELIPTELVDGTVYEIERERATAEHLQYLYRVTERTADRDRLIAHWQETAVQLFSQRYSNWLRQGTGARLRDQARYPFQHRSPDTAWDERRQDDMLVLLNVVRNESHRAVIETALALKTGDTTDRRTPEVTETVRELVQWTEDRPLYDRPSPARSTLSALVNLVADRISAPRKRIGSTSTDEST
jgi:poly-gamma-glutamate capsule biosynthesis protein CapA/YwtB (metallophosphatase superfamily)